MKHAVIYARLSMMGEEKTSIDRQVSLCIDEAKRLNLPYEVYIEKHGHRSGFSDRNRPMWQEVLEKIRSESDIQVLIVADLFRAYRSLSKMSALIELLDTRKIRFIPIKEKSMFDLSTAAGRAMFGVLSVLGQFYRDDISERKKIQYAHDRKVGARVGPAPQGLKVVGHGAERHLEASTESYRIRGKRITYLDTVRAMLELYTDSKPLGASLLTREMNSRGYRWLSRDKKCRLLQNDDSVCILRTLDSYRGILDKSLLDAALARKKEREKHQANGKQPSKPLILWGVIYCNLCHRRYHIVTRRNRVYKTGPHKGEYQQHYRHYEGDCPNWGSLNEDAIKPIAIAKLQEALEKMKLSREDKKRIASLYGKDNIAEKRQELEAQLRRLELGAVDAIAKGIFSEEVYLAKKQAIEKELSELPVAITQLTNEDRLRALDNLKTYVTKLAEIDIWEANRHMREVFKGFYFERGELKHIEYQDTYRVWLC